MTSGCRLLLLTLTLLCVHSLTLAQFSGNRGSRPVMGGWKERSIEDEDVMEAATFFLDEFRNTENSPYYIRLGKIEKAESQVVAGMNYKLTLNLEHTGCPVQETQDFKDECDTTFIHKCQARIFVQPWRNVRRLHSYRC